MNSKIRSSILSITVCLTACLLVSARKSRADSNEATGVCIRLLGDDSARPEGSATNVQNHLLERGFDRIGESNVFVNGHVLVQVSADGIVQLYFEQFYWPTDWMSLKSFPMLSAREGVLAVLRGRDGRLNIIDTKRADAPYPRRDLATPAAQRPMLEQLTRVGFEALSGTKNTLRFSSTKEDWDMIAFINDKTLDRLFKIAPSYRYETLPAKFDIVAISHHQFDNGHYSGPYSELTITDGLTESTITSFGEDDQGRIVRQKLLDPNIEAPADAIPPSPQLEAGSTFLIGGRNGSDAIDKLTTLNGIPLPTLEAELRPGRSPGVGFLGASESLKAVLRADNDYVVGEMGLTHQALSEPLRLASSIWEKGGYGPEVEFNYKGYRYTVKGTAWRGMQNSPFGDGEGTNSDIRVTNLDTGATLQYSGLVPALIHRYGFYEGHGTHHRVDPRKVIEVFDLRR